MTFFRLKGKTPPTEAQNRKKKKTEIVVSKKKKKASIFPVLNLVEEQLSVLSQNNYSIWYNCMV